MKEGVLMFTDIPNDTNDIPNDADDLKDYLKDKKKNESFVNKQRREKNNSIIANAGISIHDSLVCCFDDNVEMKSIDEICKRAIASTIIIQLAVDICNHKEINNDTIQIINFVLNKYNVSDCLNSLELKLLNGNYSEQDAINVSWNYESVWSLFWSLGLIDDIETVNNECDCNFVLQTVLTSNSYEDFKSKCKLRRKQEILDIEDLYFRYNWAINNFKIDSSTKTGNLNPSIVIERKRGLDWIFSGIDDWNDLNLDTISSIGMLEGRTKK